MPKHSRSVILPLEVGHHFELEVQAPCVPIDLDEAEHAPNTLKCQLMWRATGERENIVHYSVNSTHAGTLE